MRGCAPAAGRRLASSVRLRMAAILVALVAISIYLVFAWVLYVGLCARVSRRLMRPVSAGLMYWSALAVVPYVLAWIMVPVSFDLYRVYPSLQEPSWDISLALSISFGMILSYALGFVIACLASWRFAVRGRGTYETRAT